MSVVAQRLARFGLTNLQKTSNLHIRNMSGDISGMRKPYRTQQECFDIQHLVAKEPFEQFRQWFDEARTVDGIEANAMSLATATRNGAPSVRMVLLKGLSSEGFTFFTNYESRKAKELGENPRCSLMFYWEPLKRCVRVEGNVEKVSEEESLTYFQSRPRDSQLGAIVSQQGQVITSRQALDQRNEELQKEYSNESKAVPKPDYWGGYLVRPTVVEFWQGQSNRLHDRIVFRHLQPGDTINTETTHQGDNGWVYERLSP
ncbi:pyridoxine-5'-phosphate oxidase-like [Haliotis rubra]|uniref:pyridoxine-5'-phosphate oxidase-like n=1 Tax=Haliotis rubra TaxID=36100 RepID=UPI001EE50C62|nr:pyridoxine-5'-phosphate oxidase-like [Haliotis rubra]